MAYQSNPQNERIESALIWLLKTGLFMALPFGLGTLFGISKGKSDLNEKYTNAMRPFEHNQTLNKNELHTLRMRMNVARTRVPMPNAIDEEVAKGAGFDDIVTQQDIDAMQEKLAKMKEAFASKLKTEEKTAPTIYGK